MKPTAFKPSTLTGASAVTAAIAALTLTACGPHDNAETALATPTAQVQAAATNAVAPAPYTPPTATNPVPPAPLQGTPVPAVTAQPVYPAQSGYPAQPAPNAYAPRPNYVAERPAAESPAVDRGRIGSVASIEPIHERPQGTGAGAVIGGVLGAVVGNQFGHGAGRAGMTGVGAVGGAIAGNNLERNHREAITGYRVSIRLDNGTTRSFERSQVGGLQVGDRVRVDAGTFRRV
jgi:outer membrane lipoprotein SlyB